MDKKKIYIAGCGGMLGEAFYQQFKKKYNLKCTDIDVNENWLSYLDFRDYKLIGAVPKSKSITTPYSLNDKWGLIMGSEAHGISRDNYSHLSDTIAIPKIGKGESLNIGVAMGILLHQLTK